MGAGVALNFVLRYPQRVQALLLPQPLAPTFSLRAK
jgi:pimeloyl-ACP methyl ester carboxylesterase